MASSLPFAVRVAVGLVSESIGVLRRLPGDLTTLPVTVIGRAAKLSFQLNQQLTDLASQGDHLLASLHKPADEPERTAWSTIDDEDEVAAKDPQAAATWDSVADAVEDESEKAAADSPERALIDDVDSLEGAVSAPEDVAELTQPIAAAPVNHNSLTLSQLRSRVRSMPVEQVRAALDHEQSDLARPAFLTILSNRLSTLARDDAD